MQHVRQVELTEVVRQDRSQRRQAFSLTAQKIAQGAVAVREAIPGEEDIAYFHSVLTQVSLPRQKRATWVFERTSGHVSLRLSAGALWQPSTERWIEQPLPYGPVPCYLLAWLNTYAIRHKTNEIPLGDSAREFMEEIGDSVGGGKRGS